MQGITKSPISKLKEELTKKAVAFALNGQWDEAVGCNKAILCDYPEDVGTMNRLAKSLIELNQFVEARALLTQVIEISPYNVIAKKQHTVENGVREMFAIFKLVYIPIQVLGMFFKKCRIAWHIVCFNDIDWIYISFNLFPRKGTLNMIL